jgi:hypothetical protein
MKILAHDQEAIKYFESDGQRCWFAGSKRRISAIYERISIWFVLLVLSATINY